MATVPVFVFICDGQFPLISQVEGVEGIMAAYASALHTVALAGPTLFGHVVNNAAEIAGRSLSDKGNKYFVLLIITVENNTSYLLHCTSPIFYYSSFFAFPSKIILDISVGWSPY